MLQPATVDAHIAQFPAAIQERLQKLRNTIQKAAPKAEQTINYGIPTFKLEGNLVHFAGYKNHIGFYPGSGPIELFKKELAGFETSKGAVRFPHDKPVPYALVTQIVKYCVIRNTEKAAAKKKPAKAAKAVALKKTTGNSKDEKAVTDWLGKLDATSKKEINTVRKIIKEAAPQLNERIKWNAPSYYTSADLLTFGPYKNKTILLVFHHPAIIKIKSPLLEGDYKDRRLVKFASAAAAKKEQKELARVIKELVKLASGK